MSNSKPSDTKPLRRNAISDTRPNKVLHTSKQKNNNPKIAGFPVRIILPIFIAMILLISFSALLGWSQGSFERNSIDQIAINDYLLEQYVLAQADYNDGRYELARTRYEYIFGQDAEFLDVSERWLEVMVLLGGTATPASEEVEITPIPTIDPRPAQELYAAAQTLIAAQSWDQAIQVLSSLRTEDPTFNFVEVDQMLYVALRNRGIQKISVQGNFEAGLYDFALAEGFGPIDAAASNLRDLARLYLIGNSFWFAYPDIAALYYGQVSAVAPNLRDADGISAFYRYWASLVHYADQLATAEDWCAATSQYEIAQAARFDQNMVPTAQYVTELCLILTTTVTPTGTGTSTATSTATPGATFTATPTSLFEGSPTPTATLSTSPTATATATPTSAAPPSPTPTPTATATAGGA